MADERLIPLFDVELGDRDIAAVADTLRSGWLTMGPRTQEFEAAFAEHLGVKHAVALSELHGRPPPRLPRRGRRARRRGDRPGDHVRGHRRRGPVLRRHAGARGHRRPARPRARPRRRRRAHHPAHQGGLRRALRGLRRRRRGARAALRRARPGADRGRGAHAPAPPRWARPQARHASASRAASASSPTRSCPAARAACSPPTTTTSPRRSRACAPTR